MTSTSTSRVESGYILVVDEPGKNGKGPTGLHYYLPNYNTRNNRSGWTLSPFNPNSSVITHCIISGDKTQAYQYLEELRAYGAEDCYRKAELYFVSVTTQTSVSVDLQSYDPFSDNDLINYRRSRSLIKARQFLSEEDFVLLGLDKQEVYHKLATHGVDDDA